MLLGNRIDELSQRLLESMYVGLDRRLYRRLDELWATYGDSDGPVAIPLTQSQLADLAGGTYCGPSGPGEMSGRPQVVTASRRARDPEAARALWELSERATGLSYP